MGIRRDTCDILRVFFSKHQNTEDVNPPAVIGLFSLFSDEKADSFSMQKHVMTVVKKAIDFVNPGQTPIIEGDCPLYARLKRCQILFPNEVVEHNFVCMMGFLHLEMCLQEVGGKFLEALGGIKCFANQDCIHQEWHHHYLGANL